MIFLFFGQTRLGMRSGRKKVLRVRVNLNVLVMRKGQEHFQCERGNSTHEIGVTAVGAMGTCDTVSVRLPNPGKPRRRQI